MTTPVSCLPLSGHRAWLAGAVVAGGCVLLTVSLSRSLRRDRARDCGAPSGQECEGSGSIGEAAGGSDLTRSLAVIRQRRRLTPSDSHSRGPLSWCSSEAGSQATLVEAGGQEDEIGPRQLNMLALECLATAVSYWQEVLATAPDPSSSAALSCAVDTELFSRVRVTYARARRLLDQCEQMFLHQQDLPPPPSAGRTADSLATATSVGRTWTVISGTSGTESFYSAAGAGGRSSSVADLTEFDDLCEGGQQEPRSGADSAGAPLVLYCSAVQLASSGAVPVRKVRCAAAGLCSASEYTAKLHCLRLAFRAALQRPHIASWLQDQGRQLVTAVMKAAHRDPAEAVAAFDELVSFVLSASSEQWQRVAEELAPRNVQCFTFFDLALDYVLLDALEDLEEPPPAVLLVLQNRWLSAAFKEAALNTAIWSVLRAKRKTLRFADGFKSRYYSLAENLIPVLAWGLLGCDSALHALCRHLKDTVTSYVRDLFSFECVRFTCVEEATEDVIRLTQSHCRAVADHLASLEL